MKLGAFSISLTVKDLKASKDFYEKLGFSVFGGAMEQNYLVMKNEDDHLVGLYQGMFEKNMLTFNPGWDQNAQPVGTFTDVRELQKTIMDRGISFETEAETDSTGPAYFVVVDPDGNPILVDQHV